MKKIIVLILLDIFIIGCASVSSPVGGIKDEKAPVLIKSNPQDQSTNFKGNEIVLLFDEWMKKENIEKQLIITPRSEIEYDYKLKKEEFKLIFKEALKDSTTYTLNFREALMDITEGNLWENPRISFSTGEFLDSMYVTGNVKSLMTNKEIDGYTVGLYDPKIDTSNLRQGEPIYFTTTDKEGKYLIQNVKAGKYLLYGFFDSNDNLINEPSKEPFAYNIETIDLTKFSETSDLYSIKVNQDTLKLNNATSTGKDFTIKYNKGILEYTLINTEDTSQYIYSNTQDGGKTIQLYIENFLVKEKEWNESDSIKIAVNVIDSIGYNLKDTIYAKFRKSSITNENIKVISTSETKITGTHHAFNITLNKPTYKINYDSISLKYGDKIIRNIDKVDIALTEKKTIAKIKFDLTQKQLDSLVKRIEEEKTIDSTNNVKQDSTAKIITDTLTNTDTSILGQKNTLKRDRGEKGIKANDKANTENTLVNNQQSQNIQEELHLYLGKGAFIGIESDSTSSADYTITFKELSNYGTISGKIIGNSNKYIIELLKENYSIVDTIRNTEDYLFKWVSPGKYLIRVIIDENNNGKWDAGNPILRTASERVIHLNEEITVKANWEIIEKNIIIDPKLVEEKGEIDVDN